MSETNLSTRQVAARLNVIADTVRKWCRRGLFPNAYEVEESRGSIWLVPEKDLEGFEPPKKTGRPPKLKVEVTTKQASKKEAKK